MKREEGIAFSTGLAWPNEILKFGNFHIVVQLILVLVGL